MGDLIDREAFRKEWKFAEKCSDCKRDNKWDCDRQMYSARDICGWLDDAPAVDAVRIPPTGIGDLSDGYHTFNGLYHQRLMLFAALVKAYKEKAWKSHRHEDGELCFSGGWFIVGIDTPEGSYTYHYEDKYYDLFDCEELPVGKHWDGHTEKDVTRLLSLSMDAGLVKRGRWIEEPDRCYHWHCSECGFVEGIRVKMDIYCPHCGAKNVEG